MQLEKFNGRDSICTKSRRKAGRGLSMLRSFCVLCLSVNVFDSSQIAFVFRRPDALLRVPVIGSGATFQASFFDLVVAI